MEKWKDFNEKQKKLILLLLFSVSFIIRSLDPTHIIITAIIYIFISHILISWEKRKESLGIKKPTTPKAYIAALLGLGLILSLMIPFYIISPLCPLHFMDEILFEMYGIIGNLWLMIFILWGMMGTIWVYAEEVFFRGFMHNAVEDILKIDKNSTNLSKKSAIEIVIVSFAFGFSHFSMVYAPLYLWGVIPPDILFLTIAILTLSAMGIGLGILRKKYDSLYPSILCHSLFNVIEVAFISLILFS